ncbi:MAG: DNA alkylation repair protein [Fusobacterium sp. JB021]|nr:DNA alkylation repair protein [Fusobacterium sp. JB020]MDP0493896.1 DNA alkylation repair protein [Fusobacterium sp. JB021]
MLYNGNYNEFYEKLFKLIDEKFKNETYFERHRKIINVSREEIIGLKVPVMREVAKEISKNNWKSFLKESTNNTYEEKLIRGFVIGYVKEEYKDIEIYIKDFFKNDVDNWAICDSAISNLKIIKKNREEYFKLITSYTNSNNPWEIRVMLVSLLDYYIDDEYIYKLIEICKKVKNDHYYVKMALAWLISIMFVKKREETLKFLQDEKYNLDNWTYNKALQKITESFRVSKEDKILIKSMKIK